jgi:hypothetical protein
MENNILYRSYAIDRPIIESIEVNSFNKTFKFPESDEGIHIYKLINIMFLKLFLIYRFNSNEL